MNRTNEIILDFMDADPNEKKPHSFYNESWGAIMPIVDKIETLYSNQHGFIGVHIHSNVCNIEGTHLHLSIKNPEYGYVYMSDPNAVFNTKLESTYYNIVKFIEWYNLNKKDFINEE